MKPVSHGEPAAQCRVPRQINTITLPPRPHSRTAHRRHLPLSHWPISSWPFTKIKQFVTQPDKCWFLSDVPQPGLKLARQASSERWNTPPQQPRDAITIMQNTLHVEKEKLAFQALRLQKKRKKFPTIYITTIRNERRQYQGRNESKQKWKRLPVSRTPWGPSEVFRTPFNTHMYSGFLIWSLIF